MISNGLFLTGNSDGEEGNPIKRGVWFLSRVMDDRPPEPPPNVPEIDQGTLTLLNFPLKNSLKNIDRVSHVWNVIKKLIHGGSYSKVMMLQVFGLKKKLIDVELADGVKLRDSYELKQYLMVEKQGKLLRLP